VHAQPGAHPAPLLGPTLGVGEVDEGLAGEEGVAGEGHGPLHAGLVLGVTHPGRVDAEAARLGVLDEGLVQPGSNASAPSTMVDMLSGTTVRKTPPKKAQAASKPSITVSVVWRKLSQRNWWRE